MAEIRVTRLDQGQTKVRNVPIAVTPEGFWCCPSPVVFQKTLKTQNPLNKPKPSPSAPKASSQKKQTPLTEKKPTSNPSRPGIVSNEQINPVSDTPIVIAPVVTERMPRPKVENLPRKVSIEFGEPRTSDLKVVLHGKQGFAVRLSVHKNILVENSSFFADKLSEQQYSGLPCLEIDDCEDVEIYVETVGLMYCKDLKQRLIKQNVSRVLRILKVAEQLGFNLCIQSCLEYLEATPWVGDEEEEKVVSSVLRLQGEGIGVNPVLKRVSSNTSNPPKDTISHILELVLNSNEERGRREMKSVVLKLLRENSCLPSSSGVADICNETIYSSCRNCLNSLLSLFRQAAEPEFADKPMDSREPVVKQIALDADNLSWLLEILADRQAADEFAVTWASQEELALLHTNLPIVSRHHVSFITARLFIGIGRGELLPSKDTRHLLLQTWLEPLINDYGWLQHGRRSFDRKLVEEGIGRTILTLPLEDQQRILHMPGGIGEGINEMFRSAVNAPACVRVMSGNAADVDDMPSIPLQHAGCEFSRQDGDCRHVGIDHCHTVLDIVFMDASCSQGQPGIVYKNVDLAEVFRQGIWQVGNRRQVGDIHCHGVHPDLVLLLNCFLHGLQAICSPCCYDQMSSQFG